MPRKVYVVSPDGQLGTVDATAESQALGMGYRRAAPSELQDAKTRERANTPGGIITTFLTNAGNEFALGAPEAAVNVAAAHGVEAAQDIKRVGDTYAEENPIAATLGKVVGFGTQVLASGGTSLLAKAGMRGVQAATKAGAVGLAERVAGEAGKRAATRAAEGAAQGVAISAAASAAPAITEAIVGDPKTAVDRFIHSVTLGGLLGGTIAPAAGALGDTVKSVVGRASGKLSDSAYRLAAETAGLTPTQVRNLERFHGFSVRDIGKYLIDNGIVEIGDSGAASLTKLGQRMEDIGAKIGETLKQVDTQAGVGPDINAVLERALDKTAKPGRGTFTDAEKESMVNTIMEHLDSSDFPGANTAEALGQYKTALQQKLEKQFEKTSLPPAKQALMNLRDSIAEELEASVARAEGAGGPKLADYLGLKRDFELGISLEEGFEKQAARELSPSGSLLEKWKSSPTALLGSAIGGAAGLMSGQALLALPAAVLGGVVSNYLRRRSTSTLAGILDRAATFEVTLPKFGGLSAPVAAEASMAINAKTYPEFSRAMGALQAQPHLIGQRLPDTGNNDVQLALNDTVVRAHNFLYEKMPKNPNPSPLDPEGDYRPSDAELSKFNRYYQAVYDPRSAIEHLTPEGIEVLQAVYPTLYAELVQSVSEHVQKKHAKGEKLSYKERTHLSKFFDMPSIKALPVLQNTFNTQPQTSGGTPKLSTTGAQKMDPSSLIQTPTQRIEAR